MKKWISLLLCLAFVLPAATASAADFRDVPSTHWAYAEIQKMADRKVIEGIGDGTFAPSQPINYASFITMLAKAFYPTETAAGSEWWYPYVSALNSQDLLDNTNMEEQLKWGQTVETDLSRNEMAVLLYNLIRKQGIALPDGAAIQAAQRQIADFQTIPSRYQTAAAACYAAKLLQGDDQGNFNGENTMTRVEAAVVMSRLLDQQTEALPETLTVIPVQSALSWSGARSFGRLDNSVSRPKTGYAIGFYTIPNGDGTVSGMVVDDGAGSISVERFDAGGAVVSTKTLSMELPIFGAFFAGKTYNYIAFGQQNNEKSDSQEVWRIVQYDKDWNRVGAVSINGGQSYTTEPFRSTVARMAETADGSTVALYAARTRYDGHQSNITFVLNASPLQIKTVMGEEFPSNHVSHSFGQFIQFDGDQMATVDHGDAYPRSFVFQMGGKELELFPFAGEVGNNVTNAIGSGFEVSDQGYLFLGCSAPQTGTDENWNVLLIYVDKNLKKTQSWLTSGGTYINCARLVKLDGGTFAAMWEQDGDLCCQLLDGQGRTAGEVNRFAGIPMPPTQPAVQDGKIAWIQINPTSGNPCLYTLSPLAEVS